MRLRFYNFGPFQVDVARRALLRDGQPAQLSPKVFDTLLELIARAGEVIAKEELLAAVWPDAAVEENSLARSISTLRKALGESAADRQYIITVPGRGYSFVAEVRESGAPEPEAAVQPAKAPSAKSPRHFYRSAAFGALLAIGAAASVLTLSFRAPGVSPFEQTSIVRITGSGHAEKAAISPDGRYIAYTVMTSGEQSLLVRRTNSLHDIEIVPPAPIRYAGFTFSPDNESLYYVVRNPGQGAAVLYRIPVLGGSAQKLKEDLDSPVTLSPDGKRFAFVRESSSESTLMVADLESGAERKLVSHKLPRILDYPAWSPDGRTIVCTSFDSSIVSTNGSDARILEVSVADGRERLLPGQTWGFIRQICWLKGGHSLIISARSQESHGYHLWFVSFPGGAWRNVTEGRNYQTGASVSTDSRQVITVEENRYSVIGRLSSLDSPTPESILSEATGLSAPVWMPDGRILFEQGLNGIRTLWTVGADGKDQKQIALPGNNHEQSISKGGRLACASDRDGSSAIWTMDSDGGNAVMVAQILGQGYLSISPDGKWVVFSAFGSGHWTALWRVDSRGGQAVELNDKLWEAPVVSPDGRWIAGFYAGQPNLSTQSGPTSIAVIGLSDAGQPSAVFPMAASVSYGAGLRWTPDGKGLTYVDSGKDGDNIWSQPLSGGMPRQTTRFHGETLFNFDWSPDGKQLVFSRGIQARDVVMVQDSRPE